MSYILLKVNAIFIQLSEQWRPCATRPPVLPMLILTLGFELKGSSFGQSTKEAACGRTTRNPEERHACSPREKQMLTEMMNLLPWPLSVYFPLVYYSDIGGPQLVSSPSSFIKDSEHKVPRNQCCAGGY